jgi:hypothetical protein
VVTDRLGASAWCVRPLSGRRGLGYTAGGSKAEGLSRRPLPTNLHLANAPFLCRRYSADTLGSTHGFPGFPDHPNRASEGDTSKVWPRANSAPRVTGLESSCRGEARSEQVKIDQRPSRRTIDQRSGLKTTPTELSRCQETHGMIESGGSSLFRTGPERDAETMLSPGPNIFPTQI